MKNSSSMKVLCSSVALFFVIAFVNVNSSQAQTCNTPPIAAGFTTAGGFGPCVMALQITYDCGAGPVNITCNMMAGGDGFDLPAGCCVLSVTVVTPQQGSYTVTAATPHVAVPVGAWRFMPDPCNDHPVTNIDWDFPMGPCQPGVIHIN